MYYEKSIRSYRTNQGSLCKAHKNPPWNRMAKKVLVDDNIIKAYWVELLGEVFTIWIVKKKKQDTKPDPNFLPIG